MNISEAYSILELNNDATEDDVKKQFKKIAVKYHPDRNKDPGAESKSKEASEAYNLVIKHLEDKKNFKQNPFSRMHNPFAGQSAGFNPFDFTNDFTTFVNFGTKRTRIFDDADINYELKLSFAESVLGKKHEISVDRKMQCNLCLGKGEVPEAEACTDCNGRGFTTSTNSDKKISFAIPCQACHSQGKKHVKCNCVNGRTEIHSNFNIQIPGGVTNGTVIRLRYAGNYYGGNQTGDILIAVHVESDPDMILDYVDNDNDPKVKSSINISLLEALEGTSKTIRTVLGEKCIEIKPQSKNKDVIVLSGYGVEKVGEHIVTIHIKYPENQEDLINFLKEKCQ